MNLLPRDTYGCPYLFLAPMEGVGDGAFRKAMASLGGFNEACTEFLRVPTNAHVKSLAKRYSPSETAPIPQAAQLMGSDPELMAAMAVEIEKRGAKRIDLNCGCPSPTVTGRGAGSSLLKDPSHLYTVAKALVDAVEIPVTAKLRSGFQDTALFEDNLLAAQESGIAYLTLHPRTKLEGYTPPAHWELIAKAKSLLHIPVVGNGDILTPADAKRMLKETGCDALMIGRGAVINPWIFHEIRASFSQIPHQKQLDALTRFLDIFASNLTEESRLRNKINKLKQLASYLFRAAPTLLEARDALLRTSFSSVEEVLSTITPLLINGHGLN